MNFSGIMAYQVTGNPPSDYHVEAQVSRPGALWGNSTVSRFTLVPANLGVDPTQREIRDGDTLELYVNNQRIRHEGTPSVLQSCQGASKITFVFNQTAHGLSYQGLAQGTREHEDLANIPTCPISYRVLGGGSNLPPLFAQEVIERNLGQQALQALGQTLGFRNAQPRCIPLSGENATLVSRLPRGRTYRILVGQRPLLSIPQNTGTEVQFEVTDQVTRGVNRNRPLQKVTVVVDGNDPAWPYHRDFEYEPVPYTTQELMRMGLDRAREIAALPGNVARGVMLATVMAWADRP